ncbi:MAG: hypothetical protein KDD82_18415 [Planctomycetes bacterium]|nr:hypothetical protein [Planctomycetota bacterium]
MATIPAEVVGLLVDWADDDEALVAAAVVVEPEERPLLEPQPTARHRPRAAPRAKEVDLIIEGGPFFLTLSAAML